MEEIKKYIHYDTDLEEAVLGACLLEGGAFSRVNGYMKSEYFYHEANQVVFEIMVEMFKRGEAIDIFTVINRVVRSGHTILNGDVTEYYVPKLTNAVVSSAHLERHCIILKELFAERTLLRVRYEQTDHSMDLYDRAGNIHKQIQEILSSGSTNDWMDMTQAVVKLFQHQADMASGTKKLVTTGFKALDNKNGGFASGNMVVIGARPSVGKSALMGKMAIAMAKQNFKVGIISLEMNNTEIAARLSSLDTDIEFWKIYRTIASDEDLQRHFLDKVSRSLVQLPIYISDKTKVNINEIRAKALKLKNTEGCDVLMIDYLQLIDSVTSNRNYNREQEVSSMSRGIKLLAMEMGIPVIVLCQLNRQPTSRSYEHRFPKLSDLRESGAIEQDADVVMFIHRDFMSGYESDDQGNSTERNADLVIPKWRNGAVCHLELGFDPEKMKFYEKPAAPSGYVAINYSESSKSEEDPF